MKVFGNCLLTCMVNMKSFLTSLARKQAEVWAPHFFCCCCFSVPILLLDCEVNAQRLLIFKKIQSDTRYKKVCNLVNDLNDT